LSRLGKNSKNWPRLLLELSLRQRAFVLSEEAFRSSERVSPKRELVVSCCGSLERGSIAWARQVLEFVFFSMFLVAGCMVGWSTLFKVWSMWNACNIWCIVPRILYEIKWGWDVVMLNMKWKVWILLDGWL